MSSLKPKLRHRCTNNVCMQIKGENIPFQVAFINFVHIKRIFAICCSKRTLKKSYAPLHNLLPHFISSVYNTTSLHLLFIFYNTFRYSHFHLYRIPFMFVNFSIAFIRSMTNANGSINSVFLPERYVPHHLYIQVYMSRKVFFLNLWQRSKH